MRPSESFIAQPIRSLQTMLRVISQAYGTIPTLIPDGIYGPDTISSVSAFQAAYGLPITGITDQTTWEAIVREYDPAIIIVDSAVPLEIILDPGQVLRIGDYGPYVYLVQSMLIWLANDHSEIPPPAHSGSYDQATYDAVAAFQKLAGLKSTGHLDKITWKFLSKHYTLNAHHNSDRLIRKVSI